MSYELIKSDGTTLTEIGEGLINETSSSLTFIGKNILNYGEIQNDNFLHLLEHFSSAIEPSTPLVGQIWYDIGNKTLKLYSADNNWQSLSSVTYASTSTVATGQGALWYDSLNSQLLINNGSTFDVIAPERAPGFGTTRLTSFTIRDTLNTSHPAIKCTIDDEVIAVITNDSFSISSSTAISGFTSLLKGINLKNSDDSEVQLNGFSQYASNADKLKNQTGNYVSASTSSVANSIVQRDSSGDTSVHKLIATEISALTSGSLSGDWSVSGSLSPSVTQTYNLGTSSLRWNQLYSKSIYATTATISNAIVTTIADSSATTINMFDKDVGLTANSDLRFATQKAIKTYIDAAVATEVANRVSGDSTLQSQLNALVTVPTGTVLFTAGNTVPNGYLEANGQAVSKSFYSELYTALGGASSPYGQAGTQFNLPDLRGEFIRGWDNGRGFDTDREFGSHQDDDFKSHHHTYTRYSAFQPQSGSSTPCWYGGSTQNTGDAGGTETRPKNIALFPIIKY